MTSIPVSKFRSVSHTNASENHLFSLYMPAMQTVASRLRDTSGSSPSSPGKTGHKSTVGSTPNELELIFQSVRRQIERWGDSAIWKIDLVLLEKDGRPSSPALTSYAKPSIRPSYGSDQKHLTSSSSLQYPWDYTPPVGRGHDLRSWAAEQDMQLQLRDAMERQFYLENLVRSQAEQLNQPGTPSPGTSRAVQTLRAMHLLSEKEDQQRFAVEIRMLRKDISILLQKQRRLAETLQNMENIDVPNEDKLNDRESLLKNQRALLRKLRLTTLRLEARSTEIDYLQSQLRFDSSFGSMIPRPSKPPQRKKQAALHATLPQQQYSPKMRSEVRRPHIGLDSLGILADKMLSQPEFDSTPRHVPKKPTTPQKSPLSTPNHPASQEDEAVRERRSKRSIDSANALLAMPRLLSPLVLPSDDENSGSFDDDMSRKKARTEEQNWTFNEEKLLSKGVELHGLDHWDDVAQQVPNKTSQQCEQRWTQLQEPKQDTHRSPSIAALLNSKNDWQTQEESSSLRLFQPGPLDAELSPPSQHERAPRSPSSYKAVPAGDHPPSPMRTPKKQNHPVEPHNV